MEKKPLTIKDIAKAAGVSVGTVSRAFNNYDDISEKTRENILKIANELGYKPNIVAKSLSSNRYFRLGMLVEDYDLDTSLNPIVFEILMSFKNTASKLGYETVLLSTTSDMQKSEKIEKIFNDKQLDGAFIMGLKMTDEYFSQLSEIKYPCVLMDVSLKNPMTSCIGIDNTKGAFMAVEHLIKLGHKKIGFINGGEEACVSYERLDGYYLALNRYGMKIDRSLVEYGNFSENVAEIALQKLLEKHRDLTAVFCASDIMAIGAINKLNELGYSVPEDISIVGFDDMYLASFMTPKLTTIKQDRTKIGEIAANALLNIINGQNMERIVIEPELIIRDSSKDR